MKRTYRTKKDQIESTIIKDGMAYVDVSTKTHPDAVMTCDQMDFNMWAAMPEYGRIGAFQSTTATYPYARFMINESKQNQRKFHQFVRPDLHQNGTHIDHINRVGLDNRFDNLRDGSNGVNEHNQKIQSTNTSGKRGASWDKKSKKWRASITLGGKKKYLGLFEDIQKASDRYELAYERRAVGLPLEEL